MTILTRSYMQTGNAHILPIDRNDPSLVLYLPLWYPHGDMTGSTIYSYDKNRLACTVTGATWGVTGRTFDGAGNQIALPNSFNSLTDATIMVWFNTDSVLATQSLFNAFVDGNNRLNPFINAADSKLWLQIAVVADFKSIPSDNVLVASTWYHATFILGTGGMSMYLDGIKQAATDVSTYSFANIVATTTDIAGGDHVGFFDGVIGEVLIYNRILSVGEIAHNYQVSKWRYK